MDHSFRGIAVSPKGTAFDLEPLESFLKRSKNGHCKKVLSLLKRLRIAYASMNEIYNALHYINVLSDPTGMLKLPEEKINATILTPLLHYSIISYAKATTHNRKSRTGVAVEMSPTEKKFHKELMSLRNKVYAHLDAELDRELQAFYDEKMVLIHVGFGGTFTKLAANRKLRDLAFLDKFEKHVVLVGDKISERVAILSREFGDELRLLTFAEPRIGNIIEEQPFDAVAFFGDAEIAQTWLYSLESQRPDLMGKLVQRPDQ